MADFDVEYSPKLPEGANVLDFVGVFKFLDAEGFVRYWSVRTDNVTTVEAMGMAALLEEDMKADMWGGYDDD